MFEIKDDGTMEYSVKDTLEFSMSDFPEGSSLIFIIATDDDGASPTIIEKTYSLTGEEFLIALDEADTEKLVEGIYAYKLILVTAEGKRYTQMSGDFIVRWGDRDE